MAAFGIQLLKRGLALCGKNFQGFVDAWNHVVNRSAHLKGDGDLNPADGLVTVDNSDVDHPVIRIDRSKLKDAVADGGSSGGGDDPGGDDPGGEEAEPGVTSVNGADGAVNIIGGGGISVSTSGKTITITYQEGKAPDEDPNADPCAHDEGGGAGGGVAAGGAGGAGDGPDDFVGGVPAGGDAHPGDDDCNCD